MTNYPDLIHFKKSEANKDKMERSVTKLINDPSLLPKFPPFPLPRENYYTEAGKY